MPNLIKLKLTFRSVRAITITVRLSDTKISSMQLNFLPIPRLSPSFPPFHHTIAYQSEKPLNDNYFIHLFGSKKSTRDNFIQASSAAVLFMSAALWKRVRLKESLFWPKLFVCWLFWEVQFLWLSDFRAQMGGCQSKEWVFLRLMNVHNVLLSCANLWRNVAKLKRSFIIVEISNFKLLKFNQLFLTYTSRVINFSSFLRVDATK